MPDRNSIGYNWYMAEFVGEKAKRVISHAHAGSIYKILRDDSTRGQARVTAAFVRPNFEDPKSNWTQITNPTRLEGLERWLHPNEIAPKTHGQRPPEPQRELTIQEQEEEDSKARAAALFPKRKGSVPGWDELYG